MSTLAEFLLARIKEDEAAAREALLPLNMHPWGDRSLPPLVPEDVPDEIRGYLGGPLGEHLARHDPARVLAECEAKRFQIGLAQAAAREHAMALPGSTGALMKGRASLADAFLRGMALPYAAHPDYRAEWKP